MLFGLGWAVSLLFSAVAPGRADDSTTSGTNSSIEAMAPYLIPGMIPDQGKWVKVAQLTGDHGKNTPPVNITERRWRVTWDCKKVDKKGDPSLTVTATPDDQQAKTQDVCLIDQEGADTTELRGAGIYQFSVKGKSHWNLLIEQYVPTDDERAILAAQEEKNENWQILANYDGMSQRDTGSFTVTKDKWRVKWTAEAPSGWPDDSLGFHVVVYKQEGGMLSEVCNSNKAGHDNVEFSGQGSYFFKVSGQAKWNLVVQQTDK